MVKMVMMDVNPQAHVAIAECESRLRGQGRRVVVITLNIDCLHSRAGCNNVIELHGMFFLLIIIMMIITLTVVIITNLETFSLYTV